MAQASSNEVVEDSGNEAGECNADDYLHGALLVSRWGVNSEVARGEAIQLIDIALVTIGTVGRAKDPRAGKFCSTREDVSIVDEGVLPRPIATKASLFALLGIVSILTQAGAHIGLTAVATSVFGAFPPIYTIQRLVSARVCFKADHLVFKGGCQLGAR